MKFGPNYPSLLKKRRQRLLNIFGLGNFDLFASWKLSHDHQTDTLPQHPIVQKWWHFMADIMETNADNSPICTPIDEVFHLS